MTIDIFNLGRVLQERFPSLTDYDAPAVDLAIEELAHHQDSFRRLVDELNSLNDGDYAGLAQVLTDLQSLFEHAAEHVNEARPQLDKLLQSASSKAESINLPIA